MSGPDDHAGEPRPAAGSDPLPDLDLRLPERGTGARAARRAARDAAAGAEVQVGAPDRLAAGAGLAVVPAPSADAADGADRAPLRRAPLVAPTSPQGATPSPAPAVVVAPTPGPSRRWMTGFAAALAVSLVLAAALTAVGITTLRESSTGRRVTSADPSEPGFEGLLEPTPTLLVVHQSEGQLRSAALLSLANDDAGGSVLLLPPSVEVGDGEDAAPLSVTVAFNGTPDVVRGAGEAIAGVGVQEVVILDDARWAELVAPVAPLAIENPDAVPGFDAGPVSLGAGDVAAWLGARSPDEGELAGLYRHQLFWEAWVKAVAGSSDPAAVPGELDSGVGRFVRGLAAGPLRMATIPVIEEPGTGEDPVFRVDRDALRTIITDLVPFPTGTALAPRTRVRLLDGAGQGEHVRAAAPAVVAADATIVVVGNADTFEYRTTEIRYHQPGQRTAAERLQQALGAGTVVKDVRPIDAFDVTIVLGTDT